MGLIHGPHLLIPDRDRAEIAETDRAELGSDQCLRAGASLRDIERFAGIWPSPRGRS